MTLIKSISGIRGTLGGKPGDTLSPIDIVKFTSAYGSWILSSGRQPKVVLGRDARPSGGFVGELVRSTLMALGIDVVDLGLSTTPTVEIAVPRESAGGGIILSASHNPIQWNALKLLNEAGEFLSKEQSQTVLDLAQTDDFTFAESNKVGKLEERDDYLDTHIELILANELVDVEAIRSRNFKVVVDAVNSSGGLAIPKLLEALGVDEINRLYCEPNGQFPHNPEPLAENLQDIASVLEKGNYDLGIVVDPDVDRLAFVCEDGEMFGEEYTLVAVADYVLEHKSGPTVSNLSSTRALRDVTEKAGQTYHASAVGEVNVVAKMKEVNSVIGGEGNGGIIYPELHYGRDALIGVALFLSHLAHKDMTASRLRASYPKYEISKNKIPLTADLDLDKILDKIREKYQHQPHTTIDGLKIEFDEAWVHLRKSNTEPIIRIYSEADSSPKAQALANKLIEDIKEVISQ